MYSDGGLGASEICVSMTVASLKKVTAGLIRDRVGDREHERGATAHIAVETTTAEEVIGGKLSEHCCLLVMPGGRDLPYVERLRGKGNEAISRFVENGGGYLGICAGAYYGCSAVQFAQGDPHLEVVGRRELSFFKGVSQGPVFAGFDYSTNEGAMAADIQLTRAGMEMFDYYTESVTTSASKTGGGTAPQTLTTGVDDNVIGAATDEGEIPVDNDLHHIKIYYNGGCHFCDDTLTDEAFCHFKTLTILPPPSVSMTTSPNNNYYKVLGTYAAPDEYFSRFVSVGGVASHRPLSALIASQYGRGRVVLSGVHFEASSDLLKKHYEDDPYIESLQQHIASSDTAREQLLSACISYLLDKN